MPRKRRSTQQKIGSESCSDTEYDDTNCIRNQPQRNAANARERARMRVLSFAFTRLKTSLPWVPADTKLSKLDTLRLATSYIAHLKATLTDQTVPSDTVPCKHPGNLTWPFSFMQVSSDIGDSKLENAERWCSSESLHNNRDNTDVTPYF